MSFLDYFEDVDASIVEWFAHYGLFLMRVAMGLVFFWFGVIKFVPGMSAIEPLVGDTIYVMTMQTVTEEWSLPILAVWETLIGLGLITGRLLRVTLALLALQMIGTIMPLFIFPERTFLLIPLVPTMEGQYILKNMVLITAAMVVGATIRGGKLVSDPEQICGPEVQNLR